LRLNRIHNAATTPKIKAVKSTVSQKGKRKILQEMHESLPPNIWERTRFTTEETFHHMTGDEARIKAIDLKL
jgi:hypothetical protein